MGNFIDSVVDGLISAARFLDTLFDDPPGLYDEIEAQALERARQRAKLFKALREGAIDFPEFFEDYQKLEE